MNTLLEKIQDIRDRISQLLSQLKNICVSDLNSIPSQIDKIIVGQNKLPLLINGTIEEITDNDLQGISVIKEYAFIWCRNLVSLTMPNSITTIEQGAFENCFNMQNILIGEGVTRIGKNAFRNGQFRNIAIPNSVIIIDEGAFDCCYYLENIIIGNSVTTIGYGAFEYCYNLTSITIPDSVTTIGEMAFYACTSLTDIYLKPATPPSLGGTLAIPTTTTIHVPVGSKEAYDNATNWSYHASRIVEDIEL